MGLHVDDQVLGLGTSGIKDIRIRLERPHHQLLQSITSNPTFTSCVCDRKPTRRRSLPYVL